MGGGNAQKSKMARERNAEKNKGGKGKYPTDACPPPAPAAALCSPSRISALYLLAGSQLEANKKAMNIQVSSSSCLPCVPVEILGVFPRFGWVSGYSVWIRQIQPRRDSRTLIVNHGYASPFIFILLYVCMYLQKL